MQINELKQDDFKKIMKYAVEVMSKHLLPVTYQNGYGVEAVPKAVLLSLPELAKLPDFLASIGEKKAKKSIGDYSPEFEAWWNKFPASANFTFNSRPFKTVPKRPLKDDMDRTFIAYEAAKKKLGLTDKQMLHALETEVAERQQATWDKYASGKGDPDYNAFQFMKATIAYLNAGKFVCYLDTAEEEMNKGNNINNNDNCG